MKESEWDRRIEDARMREEVMKTLGSVTEALKISKEAQEEIKQELEEHDDILRGTTDKAGYEERLRGVENSTRMLLISVEGFDGNREKCVFGKLDKLEKTISAVENSLNGQMVGIKIQLDGMNSGKKERVEIRGQTLKFIVAIAGIIGGCLGTGMTIFGPKIIDKMFNPDPIVVPKGTPTPVPKFLKKKKKAPPPVREEALNEVSEGGDALSDQTHTEGKTGQ